MEGGHLEILRAYFDEKVGSGVEEALIHAAYADHMDVVLFFLSKGVDVNAVGSAFGNTALASASDYGHTEIVRVLLEAGVDVNAHGGLALRLAARGRYIDIVSALLNAGADVNASFAFPTGSHFYTPLVASVRNNDVAMTKILLAAGSGLEVEDGQPMRDAVGSGHSDIVRLLLHWGVDKDAAGTTSLICRAAVGGHIGVVNVLAEAGADIHADNDDALFRAATYKNWDVVDILPLPALHLNDTLLAKKLIEVGARLEACPDEEWSELLTWLEGEDEEDEEDEEEEGGGEEEGQ
ncbi:hypothetical protein HDV00_006672 [Rhizophlyctis rosea]|nr:hypothetical protein HDV00_006672 [Rhizophlyctis rosea]